MNPKMRSALSFLILGSFVVGAVLGWRWLMTSPKAQSQPLVIRNTLEFNGGLWQALFNPKNLNRGNKPPPGKPARVNSLIGLNDDENDAEEWMIEVDPGGGKKPFEVSLSELKKLPRTETAAQLRCIEGWAEDMSFAGIKFSDFMKAYQIEKQNYVGLETPDGSYYVSIDMESMLHDQTLLAYEQNGVALTKAHGAPLRLSIPIKYGIKNLKRIGRIVFSEQRPPDYWAERGYDWYSGM